jgi:hypothetical protein
MAKLAESIRLGSLQLSKKPRPLMSPDTEQWVRTYLHPPSASLKTGLPDWDVRPSFIANMKDAQQIAGPGGGSWNCLIHVPPTASDFSWSWKWLTSGTAPDFTTTATQFQYQGNAVWQNYASTCESHRPVAKSVTVELVANSLSNEGVVAAAQFRPRRRDEQTGAAGALNKVYYISNFPSTPGAISELSPASYFGQARDGVFMPLTFTSAVVPYIDTSLFTTKVANVSDGAASTLPSGVTDQSAFTGGFILFVGLNSAATLYVKSDVSVQFQAGPGTAFAAMQLAGGEPSVEAIEWALTESMARADAYDASANSFGDFLETLRDALGAAAGAAAEPVAGFLRNLPGGAMYAPAAGAALSSVARSWGGGGAAKSKSAPPLPTYVPAPVRMPVRRLKGGAVKRLRRKKKGLTQRKK